MQNVLVLTALMLGCLLFLALIGLTVRELIVWRRMRRRSDDDQDLVALQEYNRPIRNPMTDRIGLDK